MAQAMTLGPPQEPILSWIQDQDEAIAILMDAVRNDRTAQSYLFHGPRGVGKTRTAVGIAQALECAERESAPCGRCLPCRKVAAFAHPDVRLVFPTTRDEEKDPEDIAHRLEEYGSKRTALLDFARNASIGIDRIRELKGEAAKSLAEGRRRVYILCDAGRLLEEAAQSALKLIEEPPADTHLILVAEEPAALLPTIVSRCQQVRFRPVRREVIESVISGAEDIPEGAARLIASMAGGSVGRALGLMEEGSIVKTRDAAVALMLSGSDPAKIQALVREWAGGLDPNSARRVIELLLSWCHDLVAVKFGLPEDTISNLDRMRDLEQQARDLPISAIRQMIDASEEMLDSITRNVNPLLALHEMLTRFGRVGEG
jgi:DNA polymerase III subunit delta'